MKHSLFVLFTFLVLAYSKEQKSTILIEAESFDDKGGWVIDQQWMDQMGSPYLLAHGLGNPVKDAEKKIDITIAGEYFVFVRTKDWVANWNATGTPGQFQVMIDGIPLEPIFGTEGAEWHWQNGGKIELQKGSVNISLHDLTGFEGRCDAILLTLDSTLTPPNTDPLLKKWRRKHLGISEQAELAGDYDLVVIGAGIAGVCAALSASRLGLKVALINDRPVVGGNNSSEVRVWLGGDTNLEPYTNIGNIVRELEPKVAKHNGPENTGEIYEDDKRRHLIQKEKNLTFFPNFRVNNVIKEGDKITAVIAENIVDASLLQFNGTIFSDCTGDAAVGYLCGADFDSILTRHMGFTNFWSVDSTPEPVAFPRCEWALDLSDKPFPGRKNTKGIYGETGIKALGVWYWESGMDWDPINKGEQIRDWNFRAMYGAWDAIKNVDGVYPNHKIKFAAYVSGKRESRQLLGDIILTKQHLLDSFAFEDGCVPITWSMDLHLPHPDFEKGFEGNAFISYDEHTSFPRPYWIPYRTLYSRNITNLFMAGRNISVTHEALGSVRVMRTGGMMGEVIGMAAKICIENKCTPRDVYEKHLTDLKKIMLIGVGN